MEGSLELEEIRADVKQGPTSSRSPNGLLCALSVWFSFSPHSQYQQFILNKESANRLILLFYFILMICQLLFYFILMICPQFY